MKIVGRNDARPAMGSLMPRVICYVCNNTKGWRMSHDEFCRFANDNREFKSGKCFDCIRLRKARDQEREMLLKELQKESR